MTQADILPENSRIHTQENDHLLAIAKKIMENVDWRHLTTGSSGLTGQARSQLNRMLDWRCARGKRRKLFINKGLTILYSGHYRNYISESENRISDLKYELELDVRLDVMLYKNLSLAPFINYYAAEAKHFSARGENLYTGISLSYSTFFKKAKDAE